MLVRQNWSTTTLLRRRMATREGGGAHPTALRGVLLAIMCRRCSHFQGTIINGSQMIGGGGGGGGGGGSGGGESGGGGGVFDDVERLVAAAPFGSFLCCVLQPKECYGY